MCGRDSVCGCRSHTSTHVSVCPSTGPTTTASCASHSHRHSQACSEHLAALDSQAHQAGRGSWGTGQPRSPGHPLGSLPVSPSPSGDPLLRVRGTWLGTGQGPGFPCPLGPDRRGPGRSLAGQPPIWPPPLCPSSPGRGEGGSLLLPLPQACSILPPYGLGYRILVTKSLQCAPSNQVGRGVFRELWTSVDK